MKKELDLTFPDQQFKKEFPEHAKRVSVAVHNWYQFAANFYTGNLAIQTLQISESEFILRSSNNPRTVLINKIPISLAKPDRVEKMINNVRNNSFQSGRSSFGSWFNRNLSSDANRQKRTDIEEIAVLHLCVWLNSLDLPFKNDIGVWNIAEASLEKYIIDGVLPHPVAMRCVDEIKFSIFEKYVDDVLAPKDLFGVKID